MFGLQSILHCGFSSIYLGIVALHIIIDPWMVTLAMSSENGWPNFMKNVGEGQMGDETIAQLLVLNEDFHNPGPL